MNNYRKRCGNNCTGGMCSNWGATSPVYLQRNCIYIAMAYNDRLYWDGTYDDTDDAQFAECVDMCFKLLFDYNYGACINRQQKYIEVAHTTNRQAWYHDFVDGIFAVANFIRPNPQGKRSVYDMRYSNQVINSISFGLLLCAMGLLVAIAYVFVRMGAL